MNVFGLTGGIASGKSAVAARLRAVGVAVVDADQLSRDAIAPGTDGFRAVVAELGREMVLPDGSLDRKRIAAAVFTDDAKRRALNAIVHPIVGALTVAATTRLREGGEPLACYEAALIVENGLADAFRPLVVVSAPEDVQVARAARRDGATADQARARIRAQLPLADKIAVADHVIENTGTLADLEHAADAVLRAICAKLGVDPGRYFPAP